ncbi:hypothetical protein TWF225_008032 [Orbilia oligospora]|uniref:Uncharacterized protein n=1 Tax=Orbilia oligospora TaxID=2813651 RepID=A0A7C8KBA2_ORBOL|nr:hypothetical protein TWF751_006947 [Orbilia oligospora]KAF3177752.1 hypothetical protein TWF225_008032 [Orbilia oligospora]KAF3239843.1 hypothetical protein TWF217_001165 [Orbilia oligospora]KAF3260088.1 hypothetical protein TWF128_003570 [Orbilia oligospora]KAF3280303.1 hypothetical protein TWF132_011862 [Orbilia oligospora]
MTITSTAKMPGAVRPYKNPENVENKAKTRSPSNDGYILIDQENSITKSLDHGSKLAIGIRKRVSHAYTCGLPSISHRQIPRPGLPINSRTPSPTKEKDSEISMEDSIFNLLEQIEDQIADFQADFARLKRAYKNPATSITKPKSCPGRADPTLSCISHRTGSSVALQLEAEILKLRGRLEKRVSQDVVNRRRHVDKENISSELDTKHAGLPADVHDAPTRFSRFEEEKIRMADLCEVFIGAVGFAHIILAILYYFAKVSMFLFVLISPFHKFS